MSERVPSEIRRTFQRVSATLLVGGVASGIAASLAYARFYEPRQLIIREITLTLPNLALELDGLTIAFVSDLHLGGPGDNFAIARTAVEAIANVGPDLILLGGDYYDRECVHNGEFDWSTISTIAPVWGVLGNHDYNAGEAEAQHISDLLASNGVELLINTSRTVTARDGSFDLIGVDDPYSGRADLSAALSSTNENRRFRILLAHAGMIADELPVGSVDLILSGHTHGAQVRVSPLSKAGPLDLFWWLDRIKGKRLSPYRQGLFWVNGALLYVGNGLGTTSLPLRFLAPPEVAVFRLRPGLGRPDRPCDDPARYVLQNDVLFP